MTAEQHSSEALQKVEEIEQALHAQAIQRRAHQQQLGEVENALSELATAKESYRIIGNVMVKADTHKLSAELQEKKASLDSRLQSVERQEQHLRKELEKLQQQILG